ncbi:Dehydrogenase/reductase SDR family member 12 [Fusarium austroafricanum]|uniref:Dehydrogenase/reductase SDR family member 12 n=1 Tax=Fusarium austroafricanum TaxID=2364996 RepID=A0A8H4KKC3_9HYPO|nr:Dehydrogenase/reductase SDR family member 12 [Fusarium austroafricanum]
MVAISTIKGSNSTVLPKSLPENLTAVFLGATSGIGRSTTRQFNIATDNKSPTIYIVGRSHSAAVPLIAELREANPSASIQFIERDVSLVKETDAAMKEIANKETKVDLLFMSVGFMSFEGRKETKEKLEPSLTTRFYSRVRAIEVLLPLLNRSENPHVTNILAGGQEGPLIEDDLDLSKPGNYGVASAANQSATMLTLMLERFAKENPKVSFVHAFPGLTATPLLSRGSSGITGFILQWIVKPLTGLFAASPDDVGARALFYATNARFTVEETEAQAVPIPEGLSKAARSAGGVFLVDAKSEVADNEKVLVGLREKMAGEVRAHVDKVFGGVLQG